MDARPPVGSHSPTQKSSDLRKQLLVTSRGPQPAHMPLLEEAGDEAAGQFIISEPTRLAASPPQASSDSQSAAGVGIMPPPPLPKHRSPVRPADWDQYWDEKLEITVPGRGIFNVYSAGKAGAVVMCLHGGGYTGLTWSLLAAQLKHKYRVVAADLRGHGLTTTDDDLDLSRQTMADDVVAIWRHLFQASNERPPVVLMGHSMGGSIAVWAATSKKITPLEGLVVIDVVEGTALAALPHMMAIINSRPSHFPSLEEAIQWAVRTGVSKNRAAAAVSIPSQLRLQQQWQQQPPAGGRAPNVQAGLWSLAGPSPAGSAGHVDCGSPHTQGRGSAGPDSAHTDSAAPRWVWRTQLHLTQPHWDGWYRDLSETFLKVSAPKMLLLAGTDRLDKPLTIGQMQGKFQLVLMPAAGHAIQEDEATRTTEHLLSFLHRRLWNLRILVRPGQVNLLREELSLLAEELSWPSALNAMRGTSPLRPVHRFRVGEPPMVFPRAPGAMPVLPVVTGPSN